MFPIRRAAIAPSAEYLHVAGDKHRDGDRPDPVWVDRRLAEQLPQLFGPEIAAHPRFPAVALLTFELGAGMAMLAPSTAPAPPPGPTATRRPTSPPEPAWPARKAERA